MIYRYPDSPDPAVWPSHPVGSWSHALVCIAAGVDAPAESVAALAEHDRDGAPTQGSEWSEIRSAIKEIVGSREVLTTEQVTERAVAHYPDMEPGDVERALMAACPLMADPSPDDVMGGPGSFPHAVHGDTHLFSRSSAALTRAVAPPRGPGKGYRYTPAQRRDLLAKFDELTSAGMAQRVASETIGVDRAVIRRWRREAREREQPAAAVIAEQTTEDVPAVVTLPQRRELTPELAETALDRVLAGEHVTAVAKDLNVSRRAVAALAA